MTRQSAASWLAGSWLAGSWLAGSWLAAAVAAALAGAAVDAGEATVPLVASAVAVPPVPGEAATTTPRQAVSEISDASGTATASTA